MPSADLMYKYAHVMRDTPYDGAFTVMRKKEYTLCVRSGLIDPDEYTTMVIPKFLSSISNFDRNEQISRDVFLFAANV